MFKELTNISALINNKVSTQQKLIKVKLTKFNLNLFRLLKKEGFIKTIKIVDNEILCYFSYHQYKPVLNKIEMISTKHSPKFVSYQQLSYLSKIPFNGIFYLTTSKGLMTHYDAIKNKIGGKLLLKIN